MTKSLLVPHFLFRYSVPCRACGADWQRGPLPDDLDLLPSFVCELDGRARFAELRMGWNPRGLLLLLVVRGKKEPVWSSHVPSDSDGLMLWVDTRDTHNVHRATRFCHQFVFTPAGEAAGSEPVAKDMSIARATASPKPITGGVLRARSELLEDGYRLEGWIPAQALTGFDPVEHPRLGINYLIRDSERGRQTFTVGEEFPMNDPSLWGSVELIPGD
jgi:hypothetical protein